MSDEQNIEQSPDDRPLCYINYLDKQKERASRLIGLLQKEYHFNNE